LSITAHAPARCAQDGNVAGIVTDRDVAIRVVAEGNA